jgi:hypothetical protein
MATVNTNPFVRENATTVNTNPFVKEDVTVPTGNNSTPLCSKSCATGNDKRYVAFGKYDYGCNQKAVITEKYIMEKLDSLTRLDKKTGDSIKEIQCLVSSAMDLNLVDPNQVLKELQKIDAEPYPEQSKYFLLPDRSIEDAKNEVLKWFKRQQEKYQQYQCWHNRDIKQIVSGGIRTEAEKKISSIKKATEKNHFQTFDQLFPKHSLLKDKNQQELSKRKGGDDWIVRPFGQAYRNWIEYECNIKNAFEWYISVVKEKVDNVVDIKTALTGIEQFFLFNTNTDTDSVINRPHKSLNVLILLNKEYGRAVDKYSMAVKSGTIETEAERMVESAIKEHYLPYNVKNDYNVVNIMFQQEIDDAYDSTKSRMSQKTGKKQDTDKTKSAEKTNNAQSLMLKSQGKSQSVESSQSNKKTQTTHTSQDKENKSLYDIFMDEIRKNITNKGTVTSAQISNNATLQLLLYKNNSWDYAYKLYRDLKHMRDVQYEQRLK